MFVGWLCFEWLWIKARVILLYFVIKIFLHKKKISIVVSQAFKATWSVLKSGSNVLKHTQLVFPWSPNQKSAPPFLKGASVAPLAVSRCSAIERSLFKLPWNALGPAGKRVVKLKCATAETKRELGTSMDYHVQGHRWQWEAWKQCLVPCHSVRPHCVLNGLSHCPAPRPGSERAHCKGCAFQGRVKVAVVTFTMNFLTSVMKISTALWHYYSYKQDRKMSMDLPI